VNARMAGSVELAIRSGVDFPKMINSWALGEPLKEIKTYQIGQRQRWLSGDVWHLKCVFEGVGRVDTPSRGQALATFFLDFARRPGHLDLFDVRDLKPSFVEFRHGLAEPVLGRAFRSAFGRWRRLAERTNGSSER